MEPWIVAIDMDGTLLTHSLTISPEDSQAICQAAENGIHPLVITGRCPDDACSFLEKAGIGWVPVIALNGACCRTKEAWSWDPVFFPEETQQALCGILEEGWVEYSLFGDHRTAVINNRGAASFWVTNWDASPVGTDSGALDSLLKEGVCKAAYIEYDQPERLISIRQKTEKLPITVTSSGKNNLEFLPLQVDKGLALQKVAERLGISMERTAAIGDSDNDLAMLSAAGFAFAMGNGSEKVRRMAHHIVPSNQEAGVAAALKFLQNL